LFEYRRDIIEQVHLEVGHMGVHSVGPYLRTVKRMQWPDMDSDIRKVIMKCDTCKQFANRAGAFNPMRSVDAVEPWDHIAIDLAECPLDDSGYKYVLVVVDVATKFVVLKALKQKTMDTVTRKLWSIFSTFGVPKIIQSDNGTEFVNQFMTASSELMGWSRRVTTPYHPQGNGLAERHVGIMKTILWKVAERDMTHWRKYLKFVQFSMNRRCHAATDRMPQELMFPRSVNPLEDYTDAESKLMSIDEMDDRAIAMTNIVYPEVMEQTKAMHVRYKTSFDKRHKLRGKILPYEVGDIVYVQNVMRQAKHYPPWIGPCKILTKISDDVRQVQHVQNHQTYNRVHVNRLLPAEHGMRRFDAGADIVSLDIGTVWEINEIRNHRMADDGQLEYLVAWHGFTYAFNSWVLAADILTKESLIEYWNTNLDKKKHLESEADLRLLETAFLKHSLANRGYADKEGHVEARWSAADFGDLHQELESKEQARGLQHVAEKSPLKSPKPKPSIKKVDRNDKEEIERTKDKRWMFGPDCIGDEDLVLQERTRGEKRRGSPLHKDSG